MHCLVCLNGDYGEIKEYADRFSPDLVICADGGANSATQIGLVPDWVIGDMDSIDPQLLADLIENGVQVQTFIPEKDDTDAQLALHCAVEQGADQVTVLGGTGNRLDHTWSAIMSCLPLVSKGIRVTFYHPQQSIYLVTDRQALTGEKGELVSLLALTPVTGVTTHDLKYPLKDAVLLPEHPYAISNVIIGSQAAVELKSGVLMVVHITA